jgi:hypothetical protein
MIYNYIKCKNIEYKTVIIKDEKNRINKVDI